MTYLLIAVLLLAIAGVMIFLRKQGVPPHSVQEETNRKVIPLDRHRQLRSKPEEQPCSSCKRKNGKLIFYAQDNGSVVGLCRDCRDKAKKRDMLPL
ncbi:hypothetical protein F4V43_05280 [Paenibacillus spiritus]|uniref:Uncharacterized protein n=1 Tax=Paenibacillus spiritus TaxID=2496557 RepID=A0A5J5GDU9_9BACL|nr:MULTISPECIES: hypothetical protein [Paenibacillus]KAA9006369.1 hypothetical protein F4V43_05280 [Paenibacillus spiritus]